MGQGGGNDGHGLKTRGGLVALALKALAQQLSGAALLENLAYGRTKQCDADSERVGGLGDRILYSWEGLVRLPLHISPNVLCN